MSILDQLRLAALAAAALGCSAGAGSRLPEAAREIASPAAPGSAQPNLTRTDDGRALLTWLETEGAGHSMRLATRGEGGQWSTPVEVARGEGWFVNWADLPAAHASGGGMGAHWLARSGTGTYAYDIRATWSDDGGRTWAPPVLPHRDGVAAEHGFVSFVPWADGALGLVWLDGRKASGHEGHSGATALMQTTLGAGGALGPETVLDDRVCDCCQTAAARTSRGVIVAYRDRSEGEIRDIAVTRFEGGRWTPPAVVGADGWKIMGCPVNGPSVDAMGDRVALAWFAAPNDEPRVRVAFSDDGGASFGEPVRIDEGQPLGRVDAVVLPDGGALVSWLEKTKDGAEIRVEKVGRRGTAGRAVVVAASSSARASGFPRMERTGRDVVLAWTDPAQPPRVRTAVITLH